MEKFGSRINIPDPLRNILYFVPKKIDEPCLTELSIVLGYSDYDGFFK